MGESALWDAEAQAFCFLDVWGKKVLRHHPASGESESWEAPGVINAMGLCRGGGLLLAMTDTFVVLDPATGVFTKLTDPLFDTNGATFNDGAVDQRGRFV